MVHSSSSFKHLLSFVSLIILLGLPAYASFPELSSDDPIVFDQETQQILAKGNAAIKADNLGILADEITFSNETNTVNANGNVQLTRKKARFLSDEAHVNLKTQAFSTGKFRFGSFPVYAQGSAIEGTPDDVHMHNTTLYFGEPSPFALRIKSEEIQIKKTKNATGETSDKLIAKKAKLGIGNYSFITLPTYTHNLDESPIRIQAEAGQSNFLGAYARTTSFYKLSDAFKVGMLLDGYSKHGLFAGPAFEYKNLSTDPNYINGSFRSGYIGDRGKRGRDLLNRRIGKDRGIVEWQHIQVLDNGLSLNTNISYWSDSDAERDFRPSLFYDNQQPDSFAEMSYPGKNYYFSLFSRFRFNDFQRTAERLPEARFDLLTSPLGQSPFYHRLNASVARLQQRPLTTQPKLWSDRADFFYNVSCPLEINPWLTVTPLVGTRIDHYFHSSGTRENFSVVRGQFGFDAQVNSYAQWNYKNKLWDIDGVRHIVRPIMQYRYIPRKAYGTGQPAQIDVDPFSTNLPTMDLGYKRNIDDIYERHVVRFGIENTLQTRTPEYGGRDLAGVNIYQDLNIRRERKQGRFSNLYKQVFISPWHWLYLGSYGRFNVTKGKLQELRTQTKIIDGNVWEVELITDNLIRNTDQYFLATQFRLTSQDLLRFQWRYNARLHKITEHLYGYRTDLANCWGVEYQIGYRTNTSRENDIRAQVKFDLLVK